MVPIPSVREEKNRVWPNEHTQRRRKQQQQQRKNGKKTTNNNKQPNPIYASKPWQGSCSSFSAMVWGYGEKLARVAFDAFENSEMRCRLRCWFAARLARVSTKGKLYCILCVPEKHFSKRGNLLLEEVHFRCNSNDLNDLVFHICLS